jgi:hypothetical protein
MFNSFAALSSSSSTKGAFLFVSHWAGSGRMVEGGRRTCLAPEAFERLRVSRQFIGQEFQGDEAFKLGVLGFVDDAHPPAAEFLDDAVVRNGLADQ